MPTLPWALLLALLLGLVAGSTQAAEVPGVRAEYYNYVNNGTPVFPSSAATVDRVEDNISIYMLNTSPATGIGADYYLTRYTGNILIPTTGAYTFQVESDDGVRLYIDCDGNSTFEASELLVNRWVDQSTTTYQASCPGNLTAGSKVQFRVEYYERGGDQSIRLSWSGPAPVGGTPVVIPKGNGTQGLYSGVIDNVAPTITSTSLICGSSNQLIVNYSKPVQAASAQTAANYTMDGGISVTGAVLSGDAMSVALTLSPAMTASRTLTVSNVTDTSGNTIAPGTTASATFSSGSFVPGLLGTYYSQNATARAYFTGTVGVRADATVDFDWGSGNPGVSGIGVDYFSVRWTGFIQIPTTGNYVFRTVSDDGVRLSLNGTRVIDNWTDHGTTNNDTTTMSLTAGTYVPVVLEYYENGGSAVMRLQWQTPGTSSFVAIPAARLFTCSSSTFSNFVISGTGAASTCAAQQLTFTAVDAQGVTINGYTGTLSLSTSTNRGDWTVGTGPAPSGTLTPGAANSGLASYRFVAGDNGTVKLRLSHSLAQDLTVNAADANSSQPVATSGAINFRDNAFVWAEDLSNLIAGSNVVVAGRNHDMRVSLIKRDTTTGSCGVATDFAGTRSMKLWRTDNGGPWTAPGVVSPVLTVPASRPASNNLSLAFTAGVANFNLSTTDIGKFTLNLDDDSQTFANVTVSGSIGDLVVRPFALGISNLTLSGVGNTGGANPTDTVFGKAGAPFSATVTAYRWSSSADANNDGVVDSGATLAQVSAIGRTASYNTGFTLAALAGSQTPASGVLGSLGGNTVSSFSSGIATLSSLSYSEVGSFQFNTSGVVSNFLASGLTLDAVVFASNGTQQSRVGRFVPAGFVVTSPTTTHRSDLSCSPASTFTYLDENLQLAFSLTARNATGATTVNYTDTFAKLVLTTPGNFKLAGISGTTMFKTGGRLSTSASSGTWANGVAPVLLAAKVARIASIDGPFDAAQFGIAPVDSDSVGMQTLNLDTDSPANGVDSTLLGQIPLRYGRLRLQNAMSTANRVLKLPLAAQYWDGTVFKTNTLDSCTRVTSANLSFGNLRRTLSSADAVMSPASVTVDPTKNVYLTLAAPGGGRLGSMDIAIALAGTATDASCLKTLYAWTPAVAATAGANLAALRGSWCNNGANSDPTARATWGLYRGSDGVVYQRENY